MNPIYKNIGNTYEIKDNVVHMTILKKDGTELATKFDEADLSLLSDTGTWFAEWNKDYNNYLVQNISKTKKNKKSKPLKQSLASIFLNINTKAPIKYLNGDTLDNRRCNLEIAQRDTKNEYEEKNSDTIEVILKDKYEKKEGTTLISKEDLNTVITDKYTWVLHKTHGKLSVVANTPEGRIPLWKVIMTPKEDETIHFTNHNPLDNRRVNLELTKIEEDK